MALNKQFYSMFIACISLDINLVAPLVVPSSGVRDATLHFRVVVLRGLDMDLLK